MARRIIGKSAVILGILVLVLVLPLAARAEEKPGSAGAAVAQELRSKNATAEYGVNLAKLKDAGKRTTVGELNRRMCEINQRQMLVMNNHLDRMLAVLNRVTTWAGQLKNQGLNTDAVEGAVESAMKAIAGARTAVGRQGERECVIEISGSDVRVGAEVKSGISGLEKEINAVRATVRTARGETAMAIRVLAEVMGEKVTESIEEGE